jgi:hypothetical protein
LLKRYGLKLKTLFAIALFILFFIFEPIKYGAGSYNTITGEIYCTNRESCLHEVTHKYDHEQGWISQSDEWKEAVEIYRMVQWTLPQDKRDEIAGAIMFFPGIGAPRNECASPFHACVLTGGWGGYIELYAYIMQKSIEHEIPESLREFYDFDRINELMEKYNAI